MDRELSSARRLIEAMSTEWRPEDYEDTYESRVRQLVEAKRRGEEAVAGEEPPEPTNVVDLEDALRRSVDRASRPRGAPGGGGNRAGGGNGNGGGNGRSLADMSKRDLYERATERDVPGRSRMNRRQLIRALSDGHRKRNAS
ncbi:hypothetical protein [Streptomyces nanshensis]|uniref:hypothetical protein n=1 Tax=Streptomyces nanshensis TaxID=518642 RepID=UPI000B13CC57